ncbi:B3/4 domain-containing protein [Pseudomonas sp. RIT623]|uniref:B3/B4 domain-containing protein n=1 Tax=Pseudomonas sp. RIT623 TaxID=2559075 RepID=UPI0010706131|nr:phenylalanine--tRNA ligase beta subunit-related protein [Pseudomonas sp. RIT623]TFF40039.1 hypothetical protein E3U47_13210 [Pseudomonas sp. RIT623]
MIEVASALSTAWPSLRVGFLYCQLAGTVDDGRLPALGAGEPDAVAQQNIDSARRLFKACGADPSRYRPSCDALSRRVAGGKPLASVNAVVDIGNCISLRYGVCVGSYDMACLEGPIVCTVGEPQASYQGIADKTIKLGGMPAVRDTQGYFGSLHADSRRTCVGAQSQALLMLFFYASDEVNPLTVQGDASALLHDCYSYSLVACNMGVCQ